MTSHDLNDQWHQLLKSIPENKGLYRPSWFQSWLQAYKNQGQWKGEITNFTGVTEGNLQAVFPACIQKMGPFNFTSLCGGVFPNRSFPSIELTSEISDQLINKISQTRSSGVRLTPVQSSDPNISMLVDHFKKRNWKVLSKVVAADFILKLENDWEDYKAGISKKRSRNLRYYWNKLSKTGDVKLVCETQLTRDEWSQIFVELESVEKDAWVYKLGDARFAGDANQLFWNTLIQDDWFRNSIKVWRILRDNMTISYALSFDAGSERFVFSNSYIESVSEFRTGSEIYFHLIRDAYKSNIKKMNFGWGDSGYKKMWGAKPEDNVMDIILFPPTILGYVSALLAKRKGFAPN